MKKWRVYEESAVSAAILDSKLGQRNAMAPAATPHRVPTQKPPPTMMETSEIMSMRDPPKRYFRV